MLGMLPKLVKQFVSENKVTGTGTNKKSGLLQQAKILLSFKM
jgi:hypothetical protein